ncbi:Imm27 family immunity protein [Flavobacterium sp. 102]|uniref:Imm27 family immunity protein n=1 Tax=Flavobacterium sp. 102 TaxID=2135623 RepID=UPI000EAF79C0|nr:Imm27 family immunity protein [Flavobacterium sp. 102]RKS02893.1 immunity protein 27 of polymorphic toxin system [Flavobacterium sp. 102]
MKFNIELKSDENLLIGSWKMDGGKVVVDEVCERIEKLKDNYLKKVTVDKSGWEILYQDPKDKRYWLLFYSNSEYHGGSAPTLKMITQTEVTEKFGLLK